MNGMVNGTTNRMRRLREHPVLAEMVREVSLEPRQMILPLFTVPGTGVRTPVSSLHGVDHISPDRLHEAVDAALEALVADGALDRVREVLAAQDALDEPGGVADADPESEPEPAEAEPVEAESEVDQTEPDGDGESGPGDVPEAVDPSDDEPTPGYRPWGA